MWSEEVFKGRGFCSCLLKKEHESKERYHEKKIWGLHLYTSNLSKTDPSPRPLCILRAQLEGRTTFLILFHMLSCWPSGRIPITAQILGLSVTCSIVGYLHHRKHQPRPARRESSAVSCLNGGRCISGGGGDKGQRERKRGARGSEIERKRRERERVGGWRGRERKGERGRVWVSQRERKRDSVEWHYDKSKALDLSADEPLFSRIIQECSRRNMTYQISKIIFMIQSDSACVAVLPELR